MKTLKAHVENGRVVLDEPATLPEGMPLELVVPDDEDDLDEVERAALHAALDRADEQIRAGQGIPWEAVRQTLRTIK